VRIQIAVALIAFLLLRLAQAGQKVVASPLAFARLVRVNLMHRRPLDRLLDRETAILSDPRSNGAPMESRLNRTAVGRARRCLWQDRPFYRFPEDGTWSRRGRPIGLRCGLWGDVRRPLMSWA
jgi:hypothetical protein